MNIKLLTDLLMGAEHGMTSGRVLEVVPPPEWAKRFALDGWFVVTDLAVSAFVQRNEAEETDDEVTG